MTVKVDEFFRAIANAEFDKFIEGREQEFSDHVRRIVNEYRDKLVIRFLFQVEEPDVYIPYYIWGIYAMEGDKNAGVLELIPPDFGDPETYLETPEEVKGEPYFEITV